MKAIEIEGKTVEEAREKAARELGCKPEDVHTEVIKEKSGFFGLGRKVLVRATMDLGQGESTGEPQETPDWAKNPDFDPREALESVCRMIVPEATVAASKRDGRLLLEIKADGSGIFIGRKGKSLEAFQFIINKMNLKQTGRSDHIIVDSEGYLTRRIRLLKEKALELADRAYESGRTQSSEPLNAHDRRIIHTTLRNKKDISTRSIGNGDYKRVQISAKSKR